MSDYDKRYNLCAGFISCYANTPEEVLALADRYGRDTVRFITEGWCEWRDHPSGGSEGFRHTTGEVLLSTIEFMVERNKVQALLATIN